MSTRCHYITTSCCAVIILACSFSHSVAATAISTCGTRGAGSYALTANISSAGINCLIFNAGPVTLDLGGFTVSGTGATNGVLATNIPNVTVQNGTISGFARGVFATGSGAVINGMRAVTGSSNGFTVGDNSTVRYSLVNNHSGGGVIAGKYATIVENTLTVNGGNGILVSDGSSVKGNTLTQTTKALSAIKITQNCSVLNNVITGCGVGVNGLVLGNDHNLISGNTISGCVEGIDAGDHTIITGNNISNSSDNGIEAGTDCVISNNNISNNKGVGVSSLDRTLFLNNVANGNGNYGIHVNSGSSAIGNIADNNATGLLVACPSKIDNNIALGNTPNLSSFGVGCLLSNNLAP